MRSIEDLLANRTWKLSELVGFKCVGCGACEGVCPTDAVKIVEVGRRGCKPLVDKNYCTNCGLCLKVCPIQDITIPDDLSKVKKVYRARSKDLNIYLSGASGGGVSSLLVYMFDKSLIDAALVAFYDKKLNLYGDFITSKDEVLKHSGSFYQTSKQLVNIDRLKNFRSVAVVGLPCHIEALRKYAKLYNLKNIYVTISLFCTIGRTRKGLVDFVKQKFNENLKLLEFVEYKSRYGESRYGDIILKTTNGEVLIYKYPEYLEFVDYFYIPEGCFNCRKMFELNADVSVGDDWEKKTDKKFCLISINTDRGMEILSKCDLLEYEEVANPIEALLKSQPIGTPLKVYSPLLKILILKLIRLVGRLNTIFIFRRLKVACFFRAIALFGLIKLAKIKRFLKGVKL